MNKFIQENRTLLLLILLILVVVGIIIFKKKDNIRGGTDIRVINILPAWLSIKEKLDFLYNYGNKMIDFLYTKISNDVLLFMFREQQNSRAQINIPALNFMNKLFASILNKKETDRQVILSVIFFISQINSPKLFSAFSLKMANKKTFTEEDIKIIRNNLKKYISVMFE